MEPDWANLEAHPLSLILDRLEEKIDNLWFGAVCKNWRLIAKLNHQNHQFKINTIPMLMVPTNSLCLQTNSYMKKSGLFGIPNKRWYPFQSQLDLIKHNPCLCLCGSSHGWLALLDDSTSIITLINPFKDIPHIILPPLNNVYKVTLSTDPIKSLNDYVVIVISSYGNLAFIKNNQKNWSYIRVSKSPIIDVIFYKGLLFVLNNRRKIVSINIGCSNDPLEKEKIISNVILQEKVDEGIFQDGFLVKSLDEELWMVRRCTLPRKTFHVYKLKLDAKSEKLEEILKLKSLGDNILFLRKGDSISVSASYFSKSLQRDSIYFVDEYLEIYDVKSENTKHRNLFLRCYFWILPQFQSD